MTGQLGVPGGAAPEVPGFHSQEFGGCRRTGGAPDVSETSVPPKWLPTDPVDGVGRTLSRTVPLCPVYLFPGHPDVGNEDSWHGREGSPSPSGKRPVLGRGGGESESTTPTEEDGVVTVEKEEVD